MNILLVTMEMQIGGAETHIFELAKELKNRGNKVWVMSAGGEYASKLEEFGISHIFAPLKNKKPQNIIKSFNEITKTIKENKIDVVHAHARIPAFISSKVCKKLNIPFVTTSHGIYKVNALLKLLTNWGEKTLAVSDDIKAQIVRDYKLNPANVSITVNGINLDSFAKGQIDENLANELGLSKNKFHIFHVSRLDKDSSDVAKMLISISKDLDEQIENGVQIIIVGSGDNIEELNALAKDFSNVKLVGMRTDIANVLKGADAFVGVSRSALEAMAEEVPAVLAGNINYHQGFVGLFEENKLAKAIETNFCCRDEKDVTKELLIEELVKVSKMPKEQRESLGKYARKVVEDNYSIKKMVDDAEKMYKEVLR